MVLLIFAFIVGAFIGVSQILDFGSDNKNTTKIVYEDVTYNISYYENVSSSDVSDVSDNGNYSDSNLKVYDSSYFNKDKNKTKKTTNKTAK